MKARRLLVATSALAATIPAFPAAGDIPPPDAYVESCTIAKEAPTGGDCLECKDDYYQRDRCSTLLGSYCYTQRCRTWGASAWTEIYCRSSLGNTPVVPPAVLNEITLYPSQLRLTGGSTAPFGPCGSPRPLDASVGPEVSLPSAPEAGTVSTGVDASPPWSVVDVPLAVSGPEVGVPASMDASVPRSAVDVPLASSGPEVGVAAGPDARPPATTATETQTTTSPQAPGSQPKQNSSGCHLAAGTAAARTVGPLTLILVVLTLVFRDRRSRRR